MSDTSAELGLKLAVDADDTADYLTIALRNSLNVLDGVFSSSTGHNHNGAHQGGNLVFGVLNTTSILFANGATLGPFSTGNQLRFQSTNVSFSGAAQVDGALTVTGTSNLGTVTTGALSVIAAFSANSGGSLGGTFSGNPTLSGTVTLALPHTTDWWRVDTLNQGIYNVPANQGISFDANGAVAYPSGGRMWHSANDGSGSGLDADLVDNYHASQLVRRTDNIRVGSFTCPVVQPGTEIQVVVGPFSPNPLPAAATQVFLTHFRAPSDYFYWDICVEQGAGSPGANGFVVRIRNNAGTASSSTWFYLAYRDA